MSFSGDFVLKFTEGWGKFPTQKTIPIKLKKEAENCFFCDFYFVEGKVGKNDEVRDPYH